MFALIRQTPPLFIGCCLVAALVGGCASLPRIDPSGERFFIWPDQQQTVAPAVGNPFAPPVYTDPIFPVPTAPAGTPITSASPAVVPTVPPPGTPAPETLTITPQRVLAPIGSEVILQAGICTDENYLLTDQKIEWLVARDGAGELVSIGGRGWCRDPLLPWNKGKKIDNQFGVGYTAKVPLTITRGTPDTTDDVQIEPGQGWASITSPVEGTSHVTAVAPVVVGWPQRRASATVYWVDVQWTFPPLSISGGSSQVLTTNVRRQSDGTPLEGWIVRYQVADGAAALTGANSEQTTEVATGIDGNASIDVTPTGGAGNTTQINLEIVRPAGLRGSDMPLLVVARATTTIQWDGSSTYLPPADDLGPPTTYPIPGSSSPGVPSAPITPTEPSRTGYPVLDLEILGDPTGQVGGKAEYEIVIVNRGDAAATGLEMIDQFQSGFSHPGDRDRTNRIHKPLPVTLGPGQTQREYLTFDIIGAGSVCHDVTVRSAEGSEASKRACMTVSEPAPQKHSGVEVNKDGVRQNTVGETTLFRMSVKNTGEVPLTNVEILDEYDEAFQPRPRTSGYETIRENDRRTRYLWRIPRLEVGETQLFEVECLCLSAKQRACSIAQVTADGGAGTGTLLTADDHCIEIVEQRGGQGGAAPPGGADPSAAGGNQAGLRVAISPFNKKPLARSRATYQFFLENAASTPDQDVALRVIFPPEIVPDVTQVKAPVAAQLVGNELHFSPIATVRPGERLSFTVTTSLERAGIVPIIAQAVSKAHPEGVQKTEQVEILGF